LGADLAGTILSVHLVVPVFHHRADQYLAWESFTGRLDEKGDWRPVISLWMGVLLTAFFWEMWNYFSYPKWIYHVRGAGGSTSLKCPCLLWRLPAVLARAICDLSFGHQCGPA